MTTIRLTMAQAFTRYLAAQTSDVDGHEVPLFAVFLRFLGTAMSPASARRCMAYASGCRPCARITSRRWPWRRSPLPRRAGGVA
jgi:hypothetical protein